MKMTSVTRLSSWNWSLSLSLSHQHHLHLAQDDHRLNERPTSCIHVWPTTPPILHRGSLPLQPTTANEQIVAEKKLYIEYKQETLIYTNVRKCSEGNTNGSCWNANGRICDCFVSLIEKKSSEWQVLYCSPSKYLLKIENEEKNSCMHHMCYVPYHFI